MGQRLHICPTDIMSSVEKKKQSVKVAEKKAKEQEKNLDELRAKAERLEAELKQAKQAKQAKQERLDARPAAGSGRSDAGSGISYGSNVTSTSKHFASLSKHKQETLKLEDLLQECTGPLFEYVGDRAKGGKYGEKIKIAKGRSMVILEHVEGNTYRNCLGYKVSRVTQVESLDFTAQEEAVVRQIIEARRGNFIGSLAPVPKAKKEIKVDMSVLQQQLQEAKFAPSQASNASTTMETE